MSKRARPVPDSSRDDCAESPLLDRGSIASALEESEKWLRRAQRVARIGHYVFDTVTGTWTSSAALDEVFGIDAAYPHDVEGWAGVLHPDDRSMMLAYLTEDVVRDHKPFDREYRIVRVADGETRWVHGLGSLVVDDKGVATEMFGTIQDVTDRRLAEESLRESEDTFKYVFDHSVDGKTITSLNGEFHVNAAFASMLGYSCEELEGRKTQEITHPDDVEMTLHLMRALVEGELDTTRFEKRFIRKDGTTLWADVSATVRRDVEGTPLYFFTSVVDITGNKRAEQTLRESEEKYRLLFVDSPVPMWVYEAGSLAFLAVNECAIEHYGYSREEFLGMTIKDIRPPEDVPHLYSLIENHPEVTRRVPVRHLKKDGSLILVEISTHQLEFEGRQAVLVLSIDITERTQVQNELQSLLAAAPLGIGLAGGPERLMIWSNDEMTRLIGYSQDEFRGRSTRILYETEDEWRRVGAEIAGQLATARNGRVETQLVRQDGAVFDAVVHFSRVDPSDEASDMVTMVADIGERKAEQRELTRTVAQLARLIQETTEAMGHIVEARDPYTQGHQERVAALSRLLAIEMGLPEETVNSVAMAALVHDIGKLSVPAEILNKPGRLTNNEFLLIKEHSQRGYEILKDIEFPWPVAECARQHHERIDGSGYPAGLKGEDILLEARIMAVADVVEAMATHRPYRPALGLEVAVAEIADHPEKYDPQVIAACVRLYESDRLKLDQMSH